METIDRTRVMSDDIPMSQEEFYRCLDQIDQETEETLQLLQNRKIEERRTSSIRITFSIPPDGAPLTLSLVEVWFFLETMRLVGYDRTFNTVMLGMTLTRGTDQAGRPRVSDQDVGIATAVLMGLKVWSQVEGTTEEERLISFTYHLLRERRIDRKAAAQFAGDVLGREIKTNTWTQRVNRWQADHPPLPKIEIRKRAGHESDDA